MNSIWPYLVGWWPLYYLLTSRYCSGSPTWGCNINIKHVKGAHVGWVYLDSFWRSTLLFLILVLHNLHLHGMAQCMFGHGYVYHFHMFYCSHSTRSKLSKHHQLQKSNQVKLKVVLRENGMVDRCMWKDSSSCDPSHISGDAAGVTMRGVCPHAPVNHTVFFLCHCFITFMYINKILMKTRLSFFILRVTIWL